MKPLVPSDEVFRDAFAAADVSKPPIARYYLRTLQQIKDRQASNSKIEWVPNDDAQEVDLEHVLPENLGPHWPHVTREEGEALHKKIGNLAIMAKGANKSFGNLPFDKKKILIAESGYTLTSDIADSAIWGPKEIKARGLELADLAIQAWPLAGAVQSNR